MADDKQTVTRNVLGIFIKNMAIRENLLLSIILKQKEYLLELYIMLLKELKIISV